MRKVLILLYWVISTVGYGQLINRKTESMNCVKNDSASINLEINNFINKTTLDNKNISKYYVYYIKIIKNEVGCFFYNLGIIVNESDLIFADTEYYTVIDKEKLLVTLSPDVRIDEIPEMEIFELNSEEKTIIKNKLLPEKDGYIMGVYPGIVFYRCGEEFGKVYFENSDLIPTEISIYKDFIGGIEMINLNEKY